MRNSSYFRIFITTVLIVIISLSLLGGLSTVLSYRRTATEKRAMVVCTLQATARYISTQHLHYGVDLNDLSLSMWLTMNSGITGFEILVTDADGVVASCSENSFSTIGKTVPAEMLRSVEADDSAVILSTLGEVYHENRQVAGMPLTMSNNGELYTFGYLFVSGDAAAFWKEWLSFTYTFIVLALCVMTFAFILTYISTKKQAEPLNEMASAVRRFARGEFDVRVKDRGRKDEFGQLAEAFNTMADSLESAEQLRRDLITNLSHELKTPMTVITGFTEGLLDGTVPHEEEARYLGVIFSETRRLSRLVRSMLELSTLRSAESEALLENSFDVSEVVRLALLSLGVKIEEKQLDVKAELPDETILTKGDQDSITQVVYNLIDNAIKFSDPGGVIVLEVWVQGPRVYVSVENNGETIPPKELPLIFDRFHKADRSRSAKHEGAGLGLYIVKEILDKHNEDIFVTSSGGVTRFIFSLTVIH